MKRELLMGCGTNHRKKLALPTDSRDWDGLVTLDYCREYRPDVVSDLASGSLPFCSDAFDTLSAYEVLEHLGERGDYALLFRQFSDYWRVLKSDGLLYATVPCWKSLWAWGDPGHRRVINEGTLTFLSQPNYDAPGVMMTPAVDYRRHFAGDFNIVAMGHSAEGASHDTCNYWFVLQAVKPARVSV